MSHLVPLSTAELLPDARSVLRQMGVPKRAVVQEAVAVLVEQASEIFSDYAKPVCLLSEITKDDFSAIYSGEKKNADDTPLQYIYQKADSLALFSLTMGSEVCQHIGELFEADDVALGGILDATASVAADKAVVMCENYFQILLSKKEAPYKPAVLAYSPGYCGWHVSGQKKLFNALKPEKIGITLSESCLMSPIKSVSGVLVAGESSIQYFQPHWDFCENCTSYSCLQRMKRLKNSTLT